MLARAALAPRPTPALLRAAPALLRASAPRPGRAGPGSHWEPKALEAAGSARGFGVPRPRNRGNVYVPRKVAVTTLRNAGKGQKKEHKDARLLLPPYVSATELRVIFRVDYAGVFRLLGVRREQSKYFWRDHEGREFETVAKRKVVVPFEIAAIPAEGLGWKPQKLDVEPDWDISKLKSRSPPVAVVAVLGHINHGKTTLLDTLCGTAIAPTEPGGITQGVRTITGRIVDENEDSASLVAPHEYESARYRHAPPRPPPPLDGTSIPVDASRVTFIDTPGHEAFELQRGRTMAAADLAIVVVSAERGAEVQTEEVLLHAARWRVPVLFALNKIDLPGAHIELTRAELRRQCQLLHDAGHVDVDWTREAETAVPISALYGTHLDVLVRRLREGIVKLPQVPGKLPSPPTQTPGAAAEAVRIHRRTDLLTGVETSPQAVALVVEVERGAEQGERMLHLIVRVGRLHIGHYFVVGTLFGRVQQLAVAAGAEPRWKACDDGAGVGVAVQIMGIKTHFGGDCAPDDLLFAFSSDRAWRLSEHRRRLEALTQLQTKGPELRVPWEHDGGGMYARTQAAFARSKEDHPEQHASSAYKQRLLDHTAIEEFADDPDAPRIFSGGSRGAFEAPFPEGRGREQFSIEGDGTSAAAAEASGEEAASGATAGRRSARARRAEPSPSVAAPGPASRGPPEVGVSRFAVLQPDADASASEDSEAPTASSGGRKSSRRAGPTATGAWTTESGADEPSKDFVYYVDRSTWTEEAEIDSARLRTRWRERDIARWEEQARQEALQEQEKQLAEKLRREMFGESTRQDEEEEQEGAFESRPLPQRLPVVSMILKTKSVGQFDVLMDEVEHVQEEYGVKIAIVHGGLGPVVPKDVVHAEVEKEYGFCPIYAFQVGVHPVAASHAQKEAIDVRRFDVFSELVADVVKRCSRLRAKGETQQYAESLKTRPTATGL